MDSLQRVKSQPFFSVSPTKLTTYYSPRNLSKAPFSSTQSSFNRPESGVHSFRPVSKMENIRKVPRELTISYSPDVKNSYRSVISTPTGTTREVKMSKSMSKPSIFQVHSDQSPEKKRYQKSINLDNGLDSFKDIRGEIQKFTERQRPISMFDKDSPSASSSRVVTAPKSFFSPTKRNAEKEPNYFRFTVGKGNNDQVVRKVMSKRYWWKEDGSRLSNFMWQPVSSGINFTSLGANKNIKQIANHFENHREITSKIGLIKNLTAYCEKHNFNVFDITPVTFVIDLSDPNYRNEFSNFLDFYKPFSQNIVDQTLNVDNFFPGKTMRSPKLKENNLTQPLLQRKQSKGDPELKSTMYNESNIWLLKPTEYNQGRGINLFNKLSNLDFYLKCLQKGTDQTKPILNSPQAKQVKNEVNIVKSCQFVIQKYLEKPLLIDDRKFDVRVWVLLDHEMNLYCFKEKYIRLSSEKFTLDESKVTDKYIHLTNNAIQKYGKNYGKHESGNIISFHDLKGHLKTENPTADYKSITRKINEIIKISMNCIKDKINQNDRKFCFEIFGFDFIIDEKLSPWLIEVNTNPSIDESNDLLEVLIPRMIDDAFRLTIDKIFVQTEENYKPDDTKDFDRQIEFPVNGYSSDENIWEHISNLRLIRINSKN